MNAHIEVRLVSQYGVDRIFPANKAAEQFATIAGTKSLSPRTLALAWQLGFPVVVVEGAKQAVAEMIEPFVKEAA